MRNSSMPTWARMSCSARRRATTRWLRSINSASVSVSMSIVMVAPRMSRRPSRVTCWIGVAHDVRLFHMSWSHERRGYHHGNLREALVAAALALIAEKGPAGFTIAEAARLAGVSPGAPYRHFRDAEALL